MSKLILLVVAAAWAGVLLPPLLRSRLDSRPGTSITSFRRQLSTLQRSVPGTSGPMRSMARPLTGPSRHGYAAGYSAQPARRSTSVVQLDRSGYRLDQPVEAGHGRRTVRAHQAPVRVPRSNVRQRRQNVLVILGMAALAFGFLSAATTAAFARYGLVLAVCMLVGYLYLLVQLRRNEQVRTIRDTWQRAA